MLEFKQDVPETVKFRIKYPDRLLTTKDMSVWSDVLMISELSPSVIRDDVANCIRQQNNTIASHAHLSHDSLVGGISMRILNEIYESYAQLARPKLEYLFVDNDTREQDLLRFPHVFFAEILDVVDSYVSEFIDDAKKYREM